MIVLKDLIVTKCKTLYEFKSHNLGVIIQKDSCIVSILVTLFNRVIQFLEREF